MKNLIDLAYASIPGGMERQEALGQRDFNTSSVLPIDISRQDYDCLVSLGFKFLDKADDLFVNVVFPNGWKTEPTEHSMWNNLIDAKGRKRGSIFYKASFYDRGAHLRLNTRFNLNFSDNQECWITDEGQNIHLVGDWKRPNYEDYNGLIEAAKEWLATHYIDWASPYAYWD